MDHQKESPQTAISLAAKTVLGDPKNDLVKSRCQYTNAVHYLQKGKALKDSKTKFLPALGKNTASFSPSPPSDPRIEIRKVRAQRYTLLSASRALLLGEGKSRGLEYPAEYHKTAKCLHVSRGSFVDIHKSKAHGAAFYSGLVTCGSPWACPPCAAKIQERRRLEVSDAMDKAYAEGLQPVMVTLTFPHCAFQSLDELLSKQASALAQLRAGKAWQGFKQRSGFIGMIRSLELTHGQNGWHPHTHELWFVSAGAKASDMHAEILSRWERKCIKAGLLNEDDEAQVKAFRRHAVDVKGWCSNSDYLAKMDDPSHWGADREIAKASTKQGKSKGMHPFGLLADYAEGNKASGALFLDYVEAMRNKAQLYWSTGLKKYFKVDEKTDEALAQEQKEEADRVGRLDSDEWKTVREAKAQAQVLDAAEIGGWPAVVKLVERLTLAEIARLEALLSSAERPNPRE